MENICVPTAEFKKVIQPLPLVSPVYFSLIPNFSCSFRGNQSPEFCVNIFFFRWFYHASTFLNSLLISFTCFLTL